jgi:hypothetical protein
MSREGSNSGALPYIMCGKCYACFPTLDNLRNHIRLVHLSTGFPCEICGLAAPSLAKLKLHKAGLALKNPPKITPKKPL